MDGSLFQYDCLVHLLDPKLYDSFLCIPLLNTDQSTDIKNIDIPFIRKEIDLDTPPSFYLYLYDNINHNLTMSESVLLEYLSIELKKQIYFKEKWDDDFEYIRTIFIKNNDPVKF